MLQCRDSYAVPGEKHTGADIHSTVWQTSSWSIFFSRKDCSPQEGPMLEHGRSVKRKEQQRSSYGLTTTSPVLVTSATLDEGGRVRNEEPKLSLRKGDWGGIILILSLFPTTQIILTGNKLN